MVNPNGIKKNQAFFLPFAQTGFLGVNGRQPKSLVKELLLLGKALNQSFIGPQCVQKIN